MTQIARCPSCSDSVPGAETVCPRCGGTLDASATPTGTAPRPATPTPSAHTPAGPATPSPSGSRRSGAPTVGGARFAPGTLLIDRYRVVELLGRGGMGEVYRAEDLVLVQSVALKFLPGALTSDPERIERFYNEVRMAREVSHPAVCRVHDVAEADGQPFLSMEYVDGEDLAALQRRIGRLPADKALEVARQLCAGVAAAHQKRVVHRDLKPQNVMLDGRGNVRITDFGLAGLAGSIHGEDARSGTPGYMSPEQLEGREVTILSDVYAIGLILYELFTGRRAYAGRGLSEVRRQHEQPLPTPGLLVPDLDPLVERAILRCLEEDPRARPASALAVAALLPGGDPLAAALAAGETPSPEMVAAAGRADRLRPAVGWACLGVFLAGLLSLPFLSARLHLLPRLPDVRPPVVLEDRAKELLRSLGHSAAPADRARGFLYDGEYFRWVDDRDQSPRRFEKLRTGEPAVLSFWYRESPRPLTPLKQADVNWWDPPLLVTGMAGVQLDLSGRLLGFVVQPPQLETDEAAGAPEPDWAPLFAAARLDPKHFERVTPRWTPPFYCDARAAWQGVYPQRPEIPLRVEAASYRGRPVSFFLASPWTRPDREQAWQPTRAQRLGGIVETAIFVLLMSAAGFMAWRNRKLGRGDLRGAARLAGAVFALGMVVSILGAHHVRDRTAEMAMLGREAGECLLAAGILWLFYLAIEPYVRRFWPRALISWTRLLSVGPRDPLVGRDVLFGAVWGVLIAVLIGTSEVVAQYTSQPEPFPSAGALGLTLSMRRLAAGVLALPFGGLVLAMASLLMLLVLKLVLRNDRLALWCLLALLTLVQTLGFGDNRALWWRLAVAFVIMASFTLLLLRGGLLACTAGVTMANLSLRLPLTFDFDTWYGPASLMVFAAAAALALYAFRTAVYGPGSRVAATVQA